MRHNIKQIFSKLFAKKTSDAPFGVEEAERDWRVFLMYPDKGLTDKENEILFNDLIKYLECHCGFPEPETNITLDENGNVLVQIVGFNEAQVEVLFPKGFPRIAPSIKKRDSSGFQSTLCIGSWSPTKGGVLRAFHYYYMSSIYPPL